MEKIKGKVKEFMNSNDDPRTHHQRAKKVWKAMQEFLEYSAYSTLGEKGELKFEKFPSTLMTKETREAYYVFKGEIKEAEESYLKAQENRQPDWPLADTLFFESAAAQQNNKYYIKDTINDERATLFLNRQTMF